MGELQKRYLVYSKGADGGHSVVYLILAENVTQAMARFIVNQNDCLKLQADGSILEGLDSIWHPLAYVEANYKIHGEWQIRELPEWTLQQQIAEVFCGESSDGPAEIIAICRSELKKVFPRSRAKAFVWYLKQGTLVTFYRRKKPFQIEILKRYLWNWDGREERLEEWAGDYSQIAADLLLEPIRE